MGECRRVVLILRRVREGNGSVVCRSFGILSLMGSSSTLPIKYEKVETTLLMDCMEALLRRVEKREAGFMGGASSSSSSELSW